jgi:hypothetical protein
MAIPNGLAPGFYNIDDVLDRRIQDVGAETISTAIQESARIHQELVNELYSTSIMRVDWFKRRYRVDGQRRVQSLTQDGTPKPFRSGLAYDVALPLQIVGDSIAMNLWAEGKQTVQDMNDETLQILQAFNYWERRTFLAALFTATAWTYADDSDDVGNLTIQVLANGATDSQLYPLRDGSTSTIDHYLAQAADISDVNNAYDDAYAILKQHPSNMGPYVATIASDLVADTKALANFRDLPSSNIDYGTNATLAGTNLDSLRGWGHEIVGVLENTGSGVGMVVVECDDMPSGYFITEARGAGPYVGLREETVGGQSLVVRDMMVNTNHHKMDFYRRAGKGVINRVAATVSYVGTSDTYAAPTGYTAPYAGA